jgi:hypothetical protein
MKQSPTIVALGYSFSLKIPSISRISGVTTNFPPAKPTTFCLIDSDQENDPMHIAFMTDQIVADRTFPVMASFPTPSRYKVWRKQRDDVPIEFMPLWERNELKEG